MTGRQHPHEQDGDESDSKEREGVTGPARRHHPPSEGEKHPRPDNGKDGQSPDGEQG